MIKINVGSGINENFEETVVNSDFIGYDDLTDFDEDDISEILDYIQEQINSNKFIRDSVSNIEKHFEQNSVDLIYSNAFIGRCIDDITPLYNVLKSTGSIEFYCVDKECDEYSGTKVIEFVKQNFVNVSIETNNYYDIDEEEYDECYDYYTIIASIKK